MSAPDPLNIHAMVFAGTPWVPTNANAVQDTRTMVIPKNNRAAQSSLSQHSLL